MCIKVQIDNAFIKYIDCYKNFNSVNFIYILFLIKL